MEATIWTLMRCKTKHLPRACWQKNRMPTVLKVLFVISPQTLILPKTAKTAWCFETAIPRVQIRNYSKTAPKVTQNRNTANSNAPLCNFHADVRILFNGHIVATENPERNFAWLERRKTAQWHASRVCHMNITRNHARRGLQARKSVINPVEFAFLDNIKYLLVLSYHSPR